MKHGSSIRNRIVLPALSGAALLIGADVQAQTSSASAVELKEVVVTATRRTEDIQTVSMSATVLSEDLLIDKGVVDLFSLQYAAPGITVTQYGSANEFNIRGVGRSQVDIDVPSGVVIYRDGAPTIAGYFQTEPYFDIGSIEVLRGPQGTFVGKSAAGGAVFINTRDPSLDAVSGSLSWAAAISKGIEHGGRQRAGQRRARPASGVQPPRQRRLLRRHYRHLHGHPGERDLNSIRGAMLWKPEQHFTAGKVDYHDLDFGGNVVSLAGAPLFTVSRTAIDLQDKSIPHRRRPEIRLRRRPDPVP